MLLEGDSLVHGSQDPQCTPTIRVDAYEGQTLPVAEATPRKGAQPTPLDGAEDGMLSLRVLVMNGLTGPQPPVQLVFVVGCRLYPAVSSHRIQRHTVTIPSKQI
jgi:hypothetical protein